MEIALIIYFSIGLAMAFAMTVVFSTDGCYTLLEVALSYILCILVIFFLWLPVYIVYYGYYKPRMNE